MRDPRYSTAAWQRLRKAVIYRDGGTCQVRGPRCTHVATTVDHIYPVSTHPDLFWEPTNLRAACRRCNYGGGARIAADNTRRTIEDLRLLVEQQQAEIDRLIARLAHYENGGPERPRAAPRIY